MPNHGKRRVGTRLRLVRSRACWWELDDLSAHRREPHWFGAGAQPIAGHQLKNTGKGCDAYRFISQLPGDSEAQSLKRKKSPVRIHSRGELRETCLHIGEHLKHCEPVGLVRCVNVANEAREIARRRGGCLRDGSRSDRGRCHSRYRGTLRVARAESVLLIRRRDPRLELTLLGQDAGGAPKLKRGALGQVLAQRSAL